MTSLPKVQFFTLSALAHIPMHPYAIRLEIIEISRHRIWPSRSSVVNALLRLQDKGLVQECFSNPSYWLKARRGAPYELTKRGRLELQSEVLMYRETVATVQADIDMFAD